MNEEMTFKTKEELYKRVEPALYSKVKETKRLGFKHITEKDIWNYLAENDWCMRKELELHDIINDILFADNEKLNDYVSNKINRLKERQNEEISEI